MRYVIGPDVAIELVRGHAAIHGGHQLLAPTLLRSQVLSMLHERVRSGGLTRLEAHSVLDGVRGLRLRLLGDRVLQRVAWDIADELGWDGTFDAEYVALTRLQADAFVTLDERLAEVVRTVVPVAPVTALT